MTAHAGWRVGAALLVALATAARPAGAQAPDATMLPLSAAARADGPLPALLREGLREYTERLPTVRVLRWQETSGTSRYWNDATQRFFAECHAAQAACSELSGSELKALDRAARPDAQGRPGPLAAQALSAIADICSERLDGDAVFAVCGLGHRKLDAAMQWLGAGNDLLFVDYLDQYAVQRGQYLAWLRDEGQEVPASTASALPPVPAWLKAMHDESMGSLTDARIAWLAVLAEGAKLPDGAQKRIANLYIARLSWRLGDADIARELELAYEAFSTSDADAVIGCAERAEQWRLTIAHANAQHAWTPAVDAGLSALIDKGCPFSKGLAELGIDVLQSQDAPPARLRELDGLLARGLAECGDQQCSPSRHGALVALKTMVSGTPAAMRALVDAQRGALARGVALDGELQLDWAIGATLLRRSDPTLPGLPLLDDLHVQVNQIASSTRLASFGQQRNLSRFDPLHRIVARAKVARAELLSPADTESLRAQTLMRRLRLDSLAASLQDVRSADVEARHAERFAQTRQLRESASQSKLPGLRHLMEALADEAEAVADVTRLQELAVERLPVAEQRQGRFLAALGSDPLARVAVDQTNYLESPGDSLRPDDAYLSWLEVPGGYVATIMTVDPDLATGRHPLSNHFIALSANQSATIALYRELLMSGAGAMRGARRVDVEPRPAPTQRLGLGNLPVWQRADGSFVAQAGAPEGGRRAMKLAEVGRALSDWLLAPLRARWGSAHRLVVSPDGALALLPFETLWDGDRPLLDTVEVSYVQSLDVLDALTRRSHATGRRGAALLSFADPDYTVATTPAASLPGWMAALEWRALPGTRQESDALRPIFAGLRQRLGPQASRRALLDLQRTQGLDDVGILHFATHGYVDDQRSALVLSMSDGVAQAYLLDADIAKLTLRTDLVLLSACDTGLGRIARGEGVMGLPYAFMLAGNTNTLMSLWPVDDAGTAAFIPAFLAKAHAGLDLVTALAATKREFASGAYGARLADPRVWAAFVQYGVPLTLPAATTAAGRAH
jgi:CHAT domain-containing protein